MSSHFQGTAPNSTLFQHSSSEFDDLSRKSFQARPSFLRKLLAAMSVVPELLGLATCFSCNNLVIASLTAIFVWLLAFFSSFRASRRQFILEHCRGYYYWLGYDYNKKIWKKSDTDENWLIWYSKEWGCLFLSNKVL